MTNRNLQALTEAGVSIWLDDLNRPLLTGGGLAELVDQWSVTGVTSNPTIFAAALAAGDAYDEQLAHLAADGVEVDEAVFAVTTQDVRDACDLMLPVFQRTQGTDGRVSLEVDPRLAHDTDATIEAARRIWQVVDRPNLMVKIPATIAGLPAVTQAVSEGICVNVTLIFSLDRYRGVMNAYLTGLEQAREAGRDLSGIHSVASFFVSRVDSEVDPRLDELGTAEAAALRGTAAVANARLAHQAHHEVFSTPRWANLADDGAHPQRPLWASTGVKDPAYPDTKYVTDLVAADTVNTMPRATLEAFADHGQVDGDRVSGTYQEAAEQLDALERLGIGYREVVEKLEAEGVGKFVASWNELVATVERELGRVGAATS